MTIPTEFKGKHFYHFTHIENLESIVKNGFLSTNEKESKGLTHKNIAYQSIQHRRSEMDVTCAPNGKVHDYVPFYFATTNPMLLSITNNKNIDQPFLIFFAVSIEKILEDIVVFTNASANTNEPPNFYNSPEDLSKLDWTAIDKTKWRSEDDEERHNRMAEALVFKEVPLDWIDRIIVWNENFKEETIRIFKENDIKVPNVGFSPFNWRHFYFTKFQLNRGKETLVTGPYFLKNQLKRTIKEIKESRKPLDNSKCKFENIDDAITQLEANFCVIPELEGIFELETSNREHSDNVSDHTKKVVSNLEGSKYYEGLNDDDKKIVLLSAYLHDIGKGPKSKWKNGIQITYPDHPADGLSMLPRILSEDFKDISNYQIKKICLLVAYHDLIGDILEKGRSKQELINLKIDENELNMLISITIADVSSINFLWQLTINSKLSTFVEDIKKEIS
jgi:hypothetical protein